MLRVFASATLFVFLSGFAVAQEDINGITVATSCRLERRDMEGIANVNTGRGFLVAHIPPKNLIVIGTHLKASRGKTGTPDRTNAQKRELVAAAIVDVVNELMDGFPQDTIFVLGDFNAGVTDTKRNRTDLTVDSISGSGNKYDETQNLADDFRTMEALGR